MDVRTPPVRTPDTSASCARSDFEADGGREDAHPAGKPSGLLAVHVEEDLVAGAHQVGLQLLAFERPGPFPLHVLARVDAALLEREVGQAVAATEVTWKWPYTA